MYATTLMIVNNSGNKTFFINNKYVLISNAYNIDNQGMESNVRENEKIIGIGESSVKIYYKHFRSIVCMRVCACVYVCMCACEYVQYQSYINKNESPRVSQLKKFNYFCILIYLYIIKCN